MGFRRWMNGKRSFTNQAQAPWLCTFTTHLVRLRAYLSSLNAIQNVGQLASLPFCAFACDHFGRKKTLVFGACIILLGTGLQGGAQNSKLNRPLPFADCPAYHDKMACSSLREASLDLAWASTSPPRLS
jgi:MFS family permease